MKKLSLLAVLFAALLIILFVARTDSQTPLTANDLGQVQMPPQTVLGNTLPVTGPLNAVPFSQLTGAFSFPTIVPPVVNGHCMEFLAPNSLGDAGAPCNTGGGGGGGGTVTSVGMSVPSGFSVSGVPITTSGTIAINWAGTIPNAQIPAPTSSALGGVESITCSAGQFINVISASGIPNCSNPTANVTTSGGIVSDCAVWTTSTNLGSAACGGGGGSGTVTSVAVTVPTGLAIGGSPITTSGTLAFSWSGTIPNAQIPTPTASVLGGVESVTCSSGQFVNGINTSGIPGCATPAGGGNVSTSGTISSGNCAQWNSTTTLISTSAPCGSGGSGTNLGWFNIKTYGAIGDGTCHQLSSIYGSLAATQAVYPFVSDLTQCVDWAATQQAINQAFLSGPGANDSQTVYCPVGNYIIESPLFFDQANNIQGSAAAWASGTTYGNAATVTYNGIPYASLGSGNIGNTPTVSNGAPGSIQIIGDFVGFAHNTSSQVTITNASPAVLTLPSGIGNVRVYANEPMVLSTLQYALPGGSTPALPTGLNVNQVYYVVGSSISGNNFSVAATPGGAAINTSSAGVGGIFFVSSQVWQVSPVFGTKFSNRVSFIGDFDAASNSGCRFNSSGMFNNAFIFIGPQNGNIIKGISVTQAQGIGSVYRCANSTSSAGFAVTANGGGSHNTIFENVTAQGFYQGIVFGIGNGSLGDSNTLYGTNTNGNCIGVGVLSTQAFIDAIHDGYSNNNTTNVNNSQSQGFYITGGNYSSFSTLWNQFALSSVSTGTAFPSSGSPLTVTGTIGNGGCLSSGCNWPDIVLLSPNCSYGAGYYVNNANSINSGLDNPFGFSCGYNSWQIVTAHSGIVPLYMSSYNSFTNVATWQIPAYWANIFAGNGSYNQLAADIAAATTIYASEVSTMFAGQIEVDTVHVENDFSVAQLICACGGFGNARQAQMKNVTLNAAISKGDHVCCGATPSNGNGGYPQYLAGFYGQQTSPFINASGTALLIDNLTAGGNEQFSRDRALIVAGSDWKLEARNTNYTSPVLFDFVSSNQNNMIMSSAAVNPGSRFTGGYSLGLGGSSAIGSGFFDTPLWFTSAAAFQRDFGNLLGNGRNDFADVADNWRAWGWGITPTWGVRPAPWARACITSAHATTITGSLPAFTHSSSLQGWPAVTAGGTGYHVNDIITLAGGTFTSAATVGVNTIGAGGAVTGVGVTFGGVYSVEPTAGTAMTQGSVTPTGGTGVQITPNNGGVTGNWLVDYDIPYPLLWGGQQYSVCDGIDAAPAKYSAIAQSQRGYSYWQTLTTTNVPNLSWTQTGDAPFIYMNGETLQLMFPGLVLSMASDGTVRSGGGTCSTGTELFMVLEVHPTAGYVKVVRADADSGTPWLPAWASTTGTTCGNTTIGQQAKTIAQPY